ncbi:MAG: cupredoxin domain-containing protein [Chloroflexi bacterium]|nr:cupredoxin domain-containing protein [Chloroflexota bacterium]
MAPDENESPPDQHAEDEEVHQRVVLPLVLPLGVFLFAMLVIYGLSRIFLELNEVEIGGVTLATPLAIAVSLAILATAWYVASHPRISQMQIGAIAFVAAALLTGGTIFAAVYDGGEEEHVTGEPTATPSGVADVIVMGDNFFVYNDATAPEIVVAAGQEITLEITNDGNALHNMHIGDTSGNYEIGVCAVGDPEPCSDPGEIFAGDTATITFRLDEPGTYSFRCDFHPLEMVGTIRVE